MEYYGEKPDGKILASLASGDASRKQVKICSMIFSGIFEKLPNLRVAFAHGGAFPATIGRIQHGYDSRPDLCAIDNNVDPTDYLGKFWIDSLVHDFDARIFTKKSRK